MKARITKTKMSVFQIMRQVIQIFSLLYSNTGLQNESIRLICVHRPWVIQIFY
jgi:hypothetical protein